MKKLVNSLFVVTLLPTRHPPNTAIMGVTLGAHTLYHLIGLVACEVAAGFFGLFRDRQGEGLNMDSPAINADASSVGFTVAAGSPAK